MHFLLFQKQQIVKPAALRIAISLFELLLDLLYNISSGCSMNVKCI